MRIQVIGQLVFDKWLTKRALRDDGSEKNYNAIFRIPKGKEHLGASALADAVHEAAKEWAKSKKTNLPPRNPAHLLAGIPLAFKSTIKDGDMAQGQKLESSLIGHWYFPVNFDQPPMVVGPNREPMDLKDVYCGAWVRLFVRVATFNREGNQGTNLWANNLQFVAHGTPLGFAAPTAEQEFDEFTDLSDIPSVPDAAGLI